MEPHPNKRLMYAEVSRAGDVVMVGITTRAFAEGLWLGRWQAVKLAWQLVREAARR